MMISSFDIFDTCLVRKCGTPENFFDVFSLRAFNQEPPEWARQDFVVARRMTEDRLWQENSRYTLQDVWEEMDWTHPFLKTKKELCQIEQDLEREMLVPVLSMRDKVNECRKKGDKIIFISDMYLSSEFLVDVLRTHGLYQNGDSLYVSCECGCNKRAGELFRYVKEKERLSSFAHWHHYGDNTIGDYKTPRKLGIKCTLTNHEYSPYQRRWKDNDYSLGFKYPNVLAGLGRALHYSMEWNTHTDFVLDIIAPFYCSWMYLVLEDAQLRGIKRLYFCARDAYQIHKIALVMHPLFPEVSIEYVYISRQALYKEDNDAAKIAYFERIGLASKTDEVAIVDTTTSGKTLQYLNEYIAHYGYNEVSAYYYLLWNKVEGINLNNYHVQVYDGYIKNNHNMDRLLSVLFVFENFFGLTKDLKTVDYEFDKEMAVPVLSAELREEDCVFMDKIDWAAVHEEILCEYARQYTTLGLGIWSKNIFERIGNATVADFFAHPSKMYLMALEQYYFWGIGNKDLYPVVKRIYNPLELKKGDRRYGWRRGSIYLTLPETVVKLYSVLKK